MQRIDEITNIKLDKALKPDKRAVTVCHQVGVGRIAVEMNVGKP